MVRRASQQRDHQSAGRLRRRAVARAAAAALLALANWPTQAQFYAWDGAVGSAPSNLFPIDGGVAALNFGSNTLSVGSGSFGSFSALAGAQLSVAGLTVGNGGGGDGSVLFQAAQVQVGGTGNRLMVGDWGKGHLTVSAGALLDAAVNANDCLAVGAWCNNFIGSAAGSTASLTVTGAGSELRALRYFGVGNAMVYTLAANGFETGTPGGTTNTTLSVLAGGTLRTDAASIGNGPGGGAFTGNEHTVTQVNIDGAGSRWIVSPDRFNASSAAWVNVAQHANAQATIDLSNGGQWIVDGNGQGAGFDLGRGGQATLNINSGGKLQVTGGTDPQQTGVRIGRDSGSVAVATVSGTGSEINVSGHVANVDVGNGAGATGTLNVLNLGRVVSGGLNIGVNGGHGTMMVDGATVEINNGFYGRVLVGTAGVGLLTIANGGLVDATLNPGACVGVWCGNLVGYRAGATGTLTVSGAGSELRTLRNFNVADVWVDQFGGTPGANTTGTINVLAGGTLRTQGATLGSGNGGPLALGTEQSFANVLIDGVGSKWVVSRNTVDNTGAAIMSVGGHANAITNVTVSGGGLLRIDGTGGPGPNDGITIGPLGKGTVVVSGNGSRLETAGIGRFINVGATSVTGDGSFQVLAGATAESLFFNVGRNGGKGDFLIDGAGSQLTLSGVELNPAPGSFGTAGASIGRNGGTGTATVRNGGRWLITDGGQDSRSINSSPGLAVGRDANGQGILTVTGAGSTVEVVSTSLGLAPGVADNFNPFVTIGGRGNAATSTGTLTVSDGGKFILSGNAVSTVTNGRSTNLQIGGRSVPASGTCTDCIGTGIATVTGPDSEIIVQGYDAYIGVGRTLGSSGTLNVLNGGKVSSTSMLAGADAVGTINVSNGQIALAGHRTDSSAVGAGVTIGRGANAVGTLNLSNASLLTIDSTVLSGGMSVGGDQFLAGGTGNVTLSGGSSILLGGPVAGGSILVGRSGTGTMNLAGASLVDVGNTRTFSLGTQPGGNGILSVVGGSKVLANVINIGGDSDTAAGGLGSATLSGLGSEIRASGDRGFIGVGRSAVGTLTVANQGKVAAITMSVGRSGGGSGTLSVNNGTLEFAGQQTAGNLVGAGLAIGSGGASGSVSITNNSVVTMTNPGSAGAYLVLGGSTIYPQGTGNLNVSGASQINLVAAPGLARVRIGHDGTGVATFSGASLLDAGDGDVIIAGEPGSTGLLTLNTGSVLNAGYVGVGSKPGGVNGGVGTLIVNDSTVNATTLEIGSLSLLAGNGGRINGHIINRGTIGPGNSPGRLIVDGRIELADQGTIVLDVEDDGAGGFKVDELVLVKGTTYDFGAVMVTFNFIGTTDPNAFANTGALDLDTFLRVSEDGVDSTGLSADFTGGATWESLFTQATFTAASTTYDITSLDLRTDTSGTFGITAVQMPVPEPATWLMSLAGLLVIGAWSRRRVVRAA